MVGSSAGKQLYSARCGKYAGLNYLNEIGTLKLKLLLCCEEEVGTEGKSRLTLLSARASTSPPLTQCTHLELCRIQGHLSISLVFFYLIHVDFD